MKPRSLRATYEDVLDSQERLSEWVQNLIETNGFVEPEKREMFKRLVANALLGVGIKVNVRFTPADIMKFDSASSGEPFDNVEYMLRFLAYVDKQPKGSSMTFYWKKIRNAFYQAFPLALRESIHMSAEILARKETEAHEW